LTIGRARAFQARAASAIASSRSATTATVAGGEHVSPEGTIADALADHRDLHAGGRSLAARQACGRRKFAPSVISPMWKRCAFGGKFRLHLPRHEVDAQDRADHAERIGDRVADRRIACSSSRRAPPAASRCSSSSRHKMPSVWPILMPKAWPSPARRAARRDMRPTPADCICARAPGHAFEELPAVENADAVEKHDQAGEADRSGDLRLWARRRRWPGRRTARRRRRAKSRRC
jgi:hypothetical protein